MIANESRTWTNPVNSNALRTVNRVMSTVTLSWARVLRKPTVVLKRRENDYGTKRWPDNVRGNRVSRRFHRTVDAIPFTDHMINALTVRCARRDHDESARRALRCNSVII